MRLVLCYVPRGDSISKLLWSALTPTQGQAGSPTDRQLAKVVESDLRVYRRPDGRRKGHQGERSYVPLQLVITGLDAVLEGGLYSYSQSHRSRGEVSATV